MLTENPLVMFVKRPGSGGMLVVGEHIVFEPFSHSIDLADVPLNGGFLTKTLMLSPEPFMRERMRDLSVHSYSTHAVVEEPLDHLYGLTRWEAYTVQPYVEGETEYFHKLRRAEDNIAGRAKYNVEEVPDYTYNVDALSLQVVPDPKGAFPWSLYLTALGTPGLTAFTVFPKVLHLTCV
ncbi:hypothetical protein B0H17DRAFT_1145349 [Mycena rosella]|uniref:Uncharacterized protein n=1 Tax=Mycena rosella TaxID=1033263 RepID=A0AAD7G2E7_MYCRO|nr:hypothetical protein B0H17DRAFT_1145349 [Mycena rosella]